jgi:hypothetical protein
MKRQRRRQETDPIANGTGRQAFRASLNEEPIDRQSMFMSERA